MDVVGWEFNEYRFFFIDLSFFCLQSFPSATHFLLDEQLSRARIAPMPVEVKRTSVELFTVVERQLLVLMHSFFMNVS